MIIDTILRMATAIKRLTLDITVDEHRRLKTLASFHGVTMKDFLLSNVLPNKKISRENIKSGETAYLLKSVTNKERLLVANQRNRNKNKTFSSIKELKHALGI